MTGTATLVVLLVLKLSGSVITMMILMVHFIMLMVMILPNLIFVEHNGWLKLKYTNDKLIH